MKRLKWNLKVVSADVGGTLIIISINLFHTYCLQSSITRYKLLSDYSVTSDRGDKKYVLFWTTFFDVPFWGMTKETYNENDLKEINCPQSNCVFTHRKNLLPNSHDYDAIVFHGAETWNFVDLPATRSERQVFVMASMESPAEVKHSLRQDHDFYNFTMTYRLDSDIKWFYGTTIDIASGAVVAPAHSPQWRSFGTEVHDKNVYDLVEKKQKTAAWFVSHCDVLSKRSQLTKKLQTFVDVDVYGKCGTLSCPRGSSQCNEILNTTYKFYFAFENTLCVDYLTEKLYNVMSDYVVPVIFSGADLSRFLPPKSYINANDFETAEDLASHLDYLSQNTYEYLKYFSWKKYYKIVPSNQQQILCEVCKKLHNFRSKRQVYRNMEEWVYKDACHEPKIKF